MADDKKGEGQIREFLRATKIRDVMSASVKKLYEDDELSKAQEIFAHQRVFYIPIISRDDKLIGLISHKYLYKAQSPRKFIEGDPFYDQGLLVEGDSYYDKSTLDSYILRYLMHRNPYTMHPQDNLADAVIAMTRRNLGCIVIVDKDRKVLGLLTDRELLIFLARILED